jgi:hypothetical protein
MIDNILNNSGKDGFISFSLFLSRVYTSGVTRVCLFGDIHEGILYI